MTPMDHLHRFQELLRISEKLPAGNIPVPNAAVQVEWLYMSFHMSNRVEFIRSGNKRAKRSAHEPSRRAHILGSSDLPMQRMVVKAGGGGGGE